MCYGLTIGSLALIFGCYLAVYLLIYFASYFAFLCVSSSTFLGIDSSKIWGYSVKSLLPSASSSSSCFYSITGWYSSSSSSKFISYSSYILNGFLQGLDSTSSDGGDDWEVICAGDITFGVWTVGGGSILYEPEWDEMSGSLVCARLVVDMFDDSMRLFDYVSIRRGRLSSLDSFF